jgi:hypothetical protein
MTASWRGDNLAIIEMQDYIAFALMKLTMSGAAGDCSGQINERSNYDR